MTQITIPAVAASVTYNVATSFTGPFTVPFPFFDEDDVKATVIDINGAITELVHTTDFTFASLDVPIGQEGTGYESGTITLNSAIGADGDTNIEIYRDTVVSRTANFPNAGPFSMPLLNDELNRMIMVLQELDERVVENGDPANLSENEVVTGQWTLPYNTIILDHLGQARRIAMRRNIGRYVSGSTSLVQEDDDNFVEYTGAGGDSVTILDGAYSGTTITIKNKGSGILNIINDVGTTLQWMNGSSVLLGDRVLAVGGVMTLVYESGGAFPGSTGEADCWGLGIT